MSAEDIGDLMNVIWQRWKSTSPVRRGAITREQYWVLRLLAERGPMRIKDLASAIGCTAGSASVAVKRLERAGLVKRKREEEDERVVTVRLESLGLRKLKGWGREQLTSMSALFEPLSPDEKKALHDLLEKVLGASGDLPVPARGRAPRRS